MNERMLKTSREQLVNRLMREGYIKSDNVKKAFLAVPRENFVPEPLKMQAYVDRPLEIGNGQTISAPHMVAIMCEALISSVPIWPARIPPVATPMATEPDVPPPESPDPAVTPVISPGVKDRSVS